MIWDTPPQYWGTWRCFKSGDFSHPGPTTQKQKLLKGGWIFQLDFFPTKTGISNETQLGVSENGGTPKSSNLIGISIINHPFWGTPIFGNTQLGYFQLLSPRQHNMSGWKNPIIWRCVFPIEKWKIFQCHVSELRCVFLKKTGIDIPNKWDSQAQMLPCLTYLPTFTKDFWPKCR